MDNQDTIEKAKKFLQDNWETGVKCPCCKQRVQLYSHKLNVSMVRSLIDLYKLDKTEPNAYFHISKFEAWRKGYGGGQFAKVKYWGLAVDKINTSTEKRTSGMWAITDKGRQFIENQITVPSHVRIYDGKSYGFKGSSLSAKEALGSKFSYSEVMGNHYFEKPEQGNLLV